MIRILIIAFFMHMAPFLPCFSQIDQRLINSAGLTPENFMLFTDRDVYIAGEMIRFSIMENTGNQFNTPLSKVVYVELFDEKSVSVNKNTHHLEKGWAGGYMKIPVDLETGNYYVRAFTGYSRNFNAFHYPVKKIVIINPQSKGDYCSEGHSSPIMFYPEFNGLIKGIPNKVAFTIAPGFFSKTDSIFLMRCSNRHTYCEKLNKRINGLFEIIPEDTISYALMVFYNKKDTLLTGIDLLESSQSVYSVISPNGNNYHYKLVNLNGVPMTMELRIINQAGVLLLQKKIKLPSNGFNEQIDNGLLSEGLNCFILTDEKGVFADLCLHYKGPQVNRLQVSTDKQDYNRREKVSLVISNKTSSPSKLSVSVIKKGTDSDNDGNQCLYPGSLRCDPFPSFNYCHDVDVFYKVFTLAFKWWLIENNLINSLTANQSEVFWLPETRGINITGKIVDNVTGEPLAGLPVIGSVLFGKPQFHMTYTGSKGEFIISFYGLHGNRDVYVGLLKHQENAKVMINNNFAVNYPILPVGFPPCFPDTFLLKELYFNAQVNNGFGQVPLEKPSEADYYINFGEVYTEVQLDEYIALGSLEEVFREIVPYVKLRKHGKETIISIYDEARNLWYDKPVVFIDYVPVNNLEVLDEIHPSEIKSIGVIRNVYVLGNNFVQGMVFIHTKNGRFADAGISETAAFLQYQMFSNDYQELYPDYSDAMVYGNPFPDFRTTLYWNPLLTIAETRQTDFFTSDDQGTYQVIVRGINSKGEFCYGSALFDVSGGGNSKVPR